MQYRDLRERAGSATESIQYPMRRKSLGADQVRALQARELKPEGFLLPDKPGSTFTAMASEQMSPLRVKSVGCLWVKYDRV